MKSQSSKRHSSKFSAGGKTVDILHEMIQEESNLGVSELE
jgi:hypothetical protein